MVLTTIFSVKRTQKYTAHLQRSVISTMLRTIPAMKRYTFLSFASMMFIIISIKSPIAFVTMRIFAQDPLSDAQPWSWCPSTCTGSIFSRTLENNHLRFESGTCDAMLFKTFPIPLHHRNILPHLPIDVITFRYMISPFAPSDLLGPRVPHNSTGML